MAERVADLEAQGWRRQEFDGFSGLVGPFWTRREGGTVETGTNETGTNETGTRETGTSETVTRETGTNETGRRETGGNRRGFGFIVEERHLNGHGIVHGGMLMTFIDQGIGRLVWESIGRVPCATIQLSTNFVEAGRLGDFIEAHAEIVRQTRSVVFTRGSLSAAGRTLISAEGVWKVLRADPARPPPTWG